MFAYVFMFLCPYVPMSLYHYIPRYLCLYVLTFFMYLYLFVSMYLRPYVPSLVCSYVQYIIENSFIILLVICPSNGNIIRSVITTCLFQHAFLYSTYIHYISQCTCILISPCPYVPFANNFLFPYFPISHIMSICHYVHIYVRFPYVHFHLSLYLFVPMSLHSSIL